jgi:RHS repeat-associated protein
VPAGATGLAGSYSVSYGYDAANHRTRITYPAVGGLPSETVTTSYNAIGLAETLNGAAEYVWGAAYDDRTRPVWILSGSRTVPFSRTYEYDSDQRLARQRAGGGSTLMQDIQFTYNVSTGDVVERNTTLNGQSWRECYGHDDLRRLVRAYTTTGTCAAGTPGTGTAPYNHTYRYGVDGNLTARIEGGTPVNYTYPAAGAAHPHAPTAVGGDTYTWAATGELATRTVNGQAETFSWTAERQLASITGAGDSSFVYDADGQRVMRQTAAGRTLYIEGHEITASGSGVTATRSYTFGDSLVATRSSTGVEYLATDNQGSVQLAVPTAATAPSRVRAYLPYGKERSATGTAKTDRGWVGQFEDTSTGLAYLNARYYDPAIGRFISADPIFRPETPQTINPYAYGLNNPSSFTDPSGLDACDTPDCGDSFTPTKKKKKPTKGGSKSKVKKKVKKGITVREKAPSPSLPEAILDAIDKAVDDLQNNEFSGRGVCGGGSKGRTGKPGAGYVNACFVITENDMALLIDKGLMFGDGKLTGTISGVITNAHSVNDIEGFGGCAGAVVNHVSGTMCVSMKPSGGNGYVPSGFFIWLPGVSKSKGGGSVSFGHTTVHFRTSTPPLASQILDYGPERLLTECLANPSGCAANLPETVAEGIVDEILDVEISFPPLPGSGFDLPVPWP